MIDNFRVNIYISNYRSIYANSLIPIDISNIKLYGNTNYYIIPFITISGPINPRILTSNIPSKTYNKTTNITVSLSGFLNNDYIL